MTLRIRVGNLYRGLTLPTGETVNMKFSRVGGTYILELSGDIHEAFNVDPARGLFEYNLEGSLKMKVNSWYITVIAVTFEKEVIK